uniref:Uncharacterized protein n=1 Tax=Plectus sambesii TaxID=2011161 RepID=A0A914VQY7_9BILA
MLVILADVVPRLRRGPPASSGLSCGAICVKFGAPEFGARLSVVRWGQWDDDGFSRPTVVVARLRDDRSLSNSIPLSCVPVEPGKIVSIRFPLSPCIKSRTIQLRVRRKHDQRLETSLANGEARVTDAYLVSVDKDQKREVEKKLKRNYPGVKAYDMETVAARELPPNSPRPLAQCHFNGQVASDAPGPLLDDQAERLRQYEDDLRKRRQKSEQRAKEQEFLRTSLRGSKKLQSLANGNGKAVTDEEDDDDDDASDKGYANESYVPGDTSLREDIARREQPESIPLEQVIMSVNRVADQLQREPGREEDSKFLRQYFTQAPIQNAIQAAAVHRSTHKEQPTTSMPSVTTKGELRIVKLLKADDSYLVSKRKSISHRKAHPRGTLRQRKCSKNF